MLTQGLEKEPVVQPLVGHGVEGEVQAAGRGDDGGESTDSSCIHHDGREIAFAGGKFLEGLALLAADAVLK